MMKPEKCMQCTSNLSQPIICFATNSIPYPSHLLPVQAKSVRQKKYDFRYDSIHPACLILFMWRGSRTKCGSIANFFPAPWSGSCRCCMASTMESGRGLHSRQFLSYIRLVSTATKVSKTPATMMKDDYEILNSSCNSCMRL